MNKVASCGGIGLINLIAIVLVILKLTGTISISWGLIIAIWLAPAVIVCFLLLLVFIIAMVKKID